MLLHYGKGISRILMYNVRVLTENSIYNPVLLGHTEMRCTLL